MLNSPFDRRCDGERALVDGDDKRGNSENAKRDSRDVSQTPSVGGGNRMYPSPNRSFEIRRQRSERLGVGYDLHAKAVVDNNADGDGEVSGGFSGRGDSGDSADDEIEYPGGKLPRERKQPLELLAGKFDGGDQTR